MAGVYRPPHAKKTEKGPKIIIQPKYDSVMEFPSLSAHTYEAQSQKPTMNYKGFLDETERKNQENLKRLSLDPETTNKILRKNGWEIYSLAPHDEIIRRFSDYIHSDGEPVSRSQEGLTQQSEKGRVYDSTIYEETENELDLVDSDLGSLDGEDDVN
jgi:hypothetical protein